MGVRWEEPGLNKEGIVSPEGLWNQRSGSQAVLFAQLCLAAVIGVSLGLSRGAGCPMDACLKGQRAAAQRCLHPEMCFWKQEVGVCLHSYSLILFEWKGKSLLS